MRRFFSMFYERACQEQTSTSAAGLPLLRRELPSACEPACPWEAIYQDVEVPGEFKEFIEINARITGQTKIEQTPKSEQPQPTPQEVSENREKWLSEYRQRS
jgi:hypothetical protein